MARTLLLAAPPPALPHLLLTAVLLLLVAAAAATATTDMNQIILQQQNAAGANSPSSLPPFSSNEKTQVTPTTTTTTSSSSKDNNNKVGGGGFYKGMSREFVNEHNKVRARYGAGPVAWDKTLALYARRWAQQVQGDCDKARHSAKKMYGECFFLGTNGTAEDALCSWEKEEDVYDRGTLGCTPGHNFHDCGHFAIMVNKDWKWVGCGRAPCTQGPRQGQFFISCSYTGAKPDPTSPAASTP